MCHLSVFFVRETEADHTNTPDRVVQILEIDQNEIHEKEEIAEPARIGEENR
jgi:hypothetical protein